MILIFICAIPFCLNAQETQTYLLNKSTINAKDENTYNSKSGNLDKDFIKNFPSGNGDITSILKAIPNVQFDNSQLSSNTPGEIDPANISISGGLFYQNSFLLDGFNINNDLDPNGENNTNTIMSFRGNKSQGLAIDSSLLESIIVQDSNIGAAYGGFMGGVVEANTKKPKGDKWHGSLSWQYTSSKLTHYFIEDNKYAEFLQSSNENYQPKFNKNIFRASLNGKITQNLSLITSISQTRSKIPLQAYNNTIKEGTEKGSSKEQKRQIDNYYLKAYYDVSPNFHLETNIAYAPQDNTYYNEISKDSFYRIKSGGLQSGIKGIYSTPYGVWNNSLGFSNLQSSRDSDKDYWIWWQYAPDKNWAVNSVPYAYEGGYGDIKQLQRTLNYKSDYNFDEISFLNLTHKISLGAELNYQSASRERLADFYTSIGKTKDLGSYTCGVDSFGFSTCSSITPYDKPTWSGQWMSDLSYYQKGKASVESLAYGIYLEDDMELDLKNAGIFNIRPGVRFEGDDYMDKKTLAPRFALSYIAPWGGGEYKSTFVLGANRYYGRNLLSYRLYDNVLSTQKQLHRDTPNSPWEISKDTPLSSKVKFSTLDIPYSDELVLGLNQQLELFNAQVKYIHREGKDEIMRIKGEGEKEGYDKNYETWSNKGSSTSDIITLSLNNKIPLELLGVQNYLLLAFDYTQTKRGYNTQTIENIDYENELIYYDGKLISYKDRPVENFLRPHTIRLNTTHLFNLLKTQWVLNNFFRYRAPYERMVANGTIQINGEQYTKYEKFNFPSAFSWDMRLGFEKRIVGDNIFFANFDIFNVLNKKTMSALTNNSGTPIAGIANQTAVPSYESGRQFWIELGYKF